MIGILHGPHPLKLAHGGIVNESRTLGIGERRGGVCHHLVLIPQARTMHQAPAASARQKSPMPQKMRDIQSEPVKTRLRIPPKTRKEPVEARRMRPVLPRFGVQKLMGRAGSGQRLPSGLPREILFLETLDHPCFPSAVHDPKAAVHGVSGQILNPRNGFPVL